MCATLSIVGIVVSEASALSVRGDEQMRHVYAYGIGEVYHVAEQRCRRSTMQR